MTTTTTCTRQQAEQMIRNALHRWGSQSTTDLQVLMHEIHWRDMTHQQLALAAEDAVDRLVGV